MKPQDYIKFKDSDNTGQISKILANNCVEVVLDNGFVVKVSVSKITLTDAPKPEEKFPKKVRIAMPPPKVDLHIENLISNFENMSNAEKIIIQLAEFERQLDAAIACGMLEITFVHGIGSGVLREEIRKRLKDTKAVKTYLDANWDRGSTLVKFY